MLEIRRYEPGDRFQLVVDGDDLASLVMRHKVTVQYSTLWTDEDTWFQPGTAKRGDRDAVPSIFLTSALMKPENGKTDDDTEGEQDFVTPAMEDSVKQIALIWGDHRVSLATGSLGKPFAALRGCTDALLKAWDLDPAVQASLSRHAKPAHLKPMVRSIQDVYPTSMLAKGNQGRVNFRALVNAEGVVTRCDTLKSYNEPAFDALACKVVQRTRFDPALDKAGKPVPSYYAQTVIYFTG
ncbi:TonB family protein [Novosphingobium guangzhouense]|uniref:TonB family protein n=1 Tax=Novosphingobium guangzhouense TaxID=1850347 RepID=UPI00147544B7|nr:TonB family protein [Novosphingobium guangzhouense]